jgi:hypothetical protein
MLLASYTTLPTGHGKFKNDFIEIQPSFLLTDVSTGFVNDLKRI